MMDILMTNLVTDGKSRGEMTVSTLKKIKSNYRTFWNVEIAFKHLRS